MIKQTTMLEFTKMHGAGNDFMVIDAISQTFIPHASIIRQLAHRHFGIGFDQLLLVERATHPQADFRYRIFNADGGEVAQCGNGARCFVHFVRHRGLTDKREICVETASGLIFPHMAEDGRIAVNMGLPRFQPDDIPFITDQTGSTYNVRAIDQDWSLSVLSMGNPHAVLIVDDIGTAPVAELGSALQHHAQFPLQVNVGFLQPITRHRARLRVFERGTGETLSCGTGACAAAVSGIRLGYLDSPVEIETTGGMLNIRWDSDDQPVWLAGPTAVVFEGQIDLQHFQKD